MKRVSDAELINTILKTQSQKEASEVLGISQQTISNRLKNPVLQEKLAKCREQIYIETSNVIINAGKESINVLLALLKSESESMRYSAATKLLALADSRFDRLDIMTRLENLEKLNKFE